MVTDIDDQLRQVTAKYSSLRVQRNRTIVSLAGELRFRTEVGALQIRGSYQIRVELPHSYPTTLPTAYETGGLIERSFHRNPDGSLCLETPLRLRQRFAKEPTLLGYIEGSLIPFLAGHTYYLQTGRMPFGEWAHGAKGLLVQYLGVFGTRDVDCALAFLRVLSREAHLRRARCPCGSGRRFGGCHKKKLKHLSRQMSAEDYYADYRQIVFHLLTEGMEFSHGNIAPRLKRELRELTRKHPA